MNSKELIIIVLTIIFGCCIISGAIFITSDTPENKTINITNNNSTNTTDNISNSTVETQNTQTANNEPDTPNQKSNSLNYDPDLNLYYDSNGMVVDPDGEHPQGVGLSYEYMSTHSCGEE